MRSDTIIRKACLLLFALALTAFAKAQDPEPCEITCNVEMPICSESAVTLSVPNNYQYTYLWSPTGKTTNSITVRPFSTTTYQVVIRDQDSVIVCSPQITVEVMPRFQVKFRQVKLTCSNREEENGRTAQVLASVDSLGVYNPPFNYQWQISPLHIAPGDPTWAIGLEAYRFYSIKVTDGRGCMQRDSISPRAYPNPLVEITADPSDTLYLQNPHVTYSYENLSADTLDIINFYWILNQQYNITSTELEPRFTYVETGEFSTQLKVYNPQGCDTSYFHTVKLEPVKLKIPNVFTPNGDGVNDYFIISLDGGSDMPSGNGSNGHRDGGDSSLEYEGYEPLSRYYESTELTIFNRWGRVVYHSKDYQNNWDGGGLSDGTYFYVLKCHGLKNDATYQGSVMIIKSQRQ